MCALLSVCRHDKVVLQAARPSLLVPLMSLYLFDAVTVTTDTIFAAQTETFS
jgi:hypothetical protein